MASKAEQAEGVLSITVPRSRLGGSHLLSQLSSHLHNASPKSINLS